MCKVYNVRISLCLHKSIFTPTSRFFLTQPCNISLLSGYYILGFGLEISESDDTQYIPESENPTGRIKQLTNTHNTRENMFCNENNNWCQILGRSCEPQVITWKTSDNEDRRKSLVKAWNEANHEGNCFCRSSLLCLEHRMYREGPMKRQQNSQLTQQMLCVSK